MTTVLPYLTLMVAMYFIYREFSFWWNAPLIFLAGALLVRIFIIFHDCVHHSFFPSERLCSFVGSILGVLVFTAYHDWRRTHLIHHGSFANLEKRGIGDVWTMTVQEFISASSWKRLFYRVYRNPVILFGPAPIVLFLIWNRFPVKGAGRKEILSVLFMNAVLIAIIVLALLTFGIREYIMIQLPVIALAGIFGMWLFFIQHQYEGVRWWHTEEWSSYQASMQGSSYYDLPAVLRWFSGNIGYHHIHHLSPRIPNYNLKRCYEENPELKEIITIKLFRGFRSIFLQLWDESSKELISIREAKRRMGNGVAM